MSIKSKILLPMVVLTIAVAAAILISNIILFSSYVDGNMSDRVDVASAVAEEKLDSHKKESSVASAYMSKDASIIDAIMAGNRDALLARATQLQNEVGVEFCTITDSEGTVLARAHEPEKFGDSITSQSNVTSALSGKSLTAIEKGTAVLLSVRSGSPVYDGQGKLIGVVSVGFRLDTEAFVDAVKAILNCEVTVFLGDERISTTVVKEDGTRAVGTKAMETVSDAVLKGQTYVGEAEILGRNALTKYVPINGTDGKAVGMLFVGRYLDEKTNTVLGFMWTDLLIVLILLALSVPIILILVKRIVTPIEHMVDASLSLAAGDTEISVNVDTKDEMRQLADAFNEMIQNTRMQTQTIGTIASGDLTVSVTVRSIKDRMNQALETMLKRNNEVFSQIVGSAVQVTTGARQIAGSSQALAQGATEQAAAVEELSGIINQVEANTTDNAALADKAAVLAENIKDNAETGSGRMEQMVRAVREINEASQSIGKIIKVIDDIAFQTNILALNAAVEAARAGQHGKGFAVVAEEVRNLAARSGDAAKDTGAIIENSIARAELGVRIATETSESFAEIVSGINESGQIVSEIAKSSEQQRAAISQINQGINQVAQVVHQNTATAEESAASSEEMSRQAELLQGLVSRFKLRAPAETGTKPVLVAHQSLRSDFSLTPMAGAGS